MVKVLNSLSQICYCLAPKFWAINFCKPQFIHLLNGDNDPTFHSSKDELRSYRLKHFIYCKVLRKYTTTFGIHNRNQTRNIRNTPFPISCPHKAWLTSCLEFCEISLDVISGVLSLTPLTIFVYFSGVWSNQTNPWLKQQMPPKDFPSSQTAKSCWTNKSLLQLPLRCPTYSL